MSGRNNRRSAARKKREQTVIKLILLIWMIAMVLACVGCAVLWGKVRKLNVSLQTVTSRLDAVNNELLEQRSLLESLTAKKATEEKSAGDKDIKEKTGQEQQNISDNHTVQSEGQEGTGEGETENEFSNTPEILARHKVYLTFDDGPSAHTEEILDILDRYDVKATFFVVGKDDETSKERLRLIVERGHSLGMHSYSHEYSEIYKSVADFEYDFMKIQNYLYDVTGVRSTIYRFPGGSSNLVSDVDMQEFAEYLQEQGVTFYDWNISSGDGGSVQPSVQDLLDNCTKDIENWETSVILLHDSSDKDTTLEALPSIIENILAMEDTVILPITEETKPVQHIKLLDAQIQ